MKTLRVIFALAAICGFSIGTGFTTLTAEVGQAGFGWSVLALFLVWLLGMISGKLYMEAFIAVPDAKHYYSLSRKITSVWNSRSLTFVFLFYSYFSLIFYILFTHDVVRMILEHYHLQPTIVPHDIMWPLAIVLGLLVFFGRMPTFATVTALLAFFFIFFGVEVFYSPLWPFSGNKLRSQSLFFFTAAGAIFNLTFFQTIMPSIIQFLRKERKPCLIALWVGWTLAMLFYLLWLWITMRPEIYGKFLAAFEVKTSFHGALAFLVDLSQLKFLVRILASSAGLISILCVALPMKDFFEDLFAHRWQKYPFWKSIGIVLLIFVPSFLFTKLLHTYIIIFTTILSAFTQFLLATVYPLSWVWNIRYRLHLPHKPVLLGGKPILIGVIFASVILLLILITVPINQLYW